jgi:tyrosine-specific transport protein
MILFFKIIPRINPDFISYLSLNLKDYFLPYGVILFSIDGMAVVPEIKEILKNEEKSMKEVIIFGSIIPIIVYLIFIISVFGITGFNTTTEGMIGLSSVIGRGVMYIGFIFGILATFTSYLTMGDTLKKEFHYDWKVPHFTAWVLACFPALLLYLAGFKNFIGIIGFVGAVSFGIDIIIITAIYLKAKTKGQVKPAYNLNISKGWIYLMLAMFLSGVIIETVKVLI